MGEHQEMNTFEEKGGGDPVPPTGKTGKEPFPRPEADEADEIDEESNG